MIKARHIRFYVKLFNFYTRYNLRKHFSRISIHHDLTVNSLPVLLIGNHSTWWDGFFAVYLNLELFKRRLYVMMLETQLDKRRFFQKAGAFSIHPGGRSIFETIEYSKEILQRNNGLLLMFPQGEIQSSYQYPVKFKKGILKIIEDLKNPVQLIFFCALTDYFSNKKPRLDFYLTGYRYGTNPDIQGMEKAYNDFLMECISKQKE